MAIRDIHLLGSPVLREVAAEVSEVNDEVRAFIEDLYDTMDAASGIGIAANQVGVAQRVAVIDADGHTFAMINPKIVSKGKRKASAEEGCLSIPDLAADVNRPESLVLEAINEKGEPFRIEASGLLARAIQHEIDHLDGILFIDRLPVIKRELLVRRWKKENADLGLTMTPVPDEESDRKD